MKRISIGILFSLSLLAAADNSVLQRNATVHPVSGPDLPNAAVLVQDGMIVEVSKWYEILFDPFVGSAFKSNAQGSVKSTPIKADLPADGVIFKYTVVSTDESGCAPLDPRLKVRG